MAIHAYYNHGNVLMVFIKGVGFLWYSDYTLKTFPEPLKHSEFK
jgi:hypothetical protein